MGKRRMTSRILALALGVSVILLALIGFFGQSVWVRQVITDGSSVLKSSAWEEAARYAWQDLGPLRSAGTEDDRAPTFEEGSRDLYFARKWEGVQWDIYRSRWTPQGYEEPAPLHEINSPWSDTDPVLTDGGRKLIFASDRPGGSGGFDLYMSVRGRDGFGPPTRFDVGVNSVHDDRSPTFSEDGNRLIFASNRKAEDGVRLDLFECQRVGEVFEEPVLMAPLQSPDAGESRDPTLGSDGRVLVFASDREGGPGGFDLYRSVRFGSEWQKPALLKELSTAGDETDPAFSSEGGLLVFAASRSKDELWTRTLRMAERRDLIAIDQASTFPPGLLDALIALAIAALLSYLGLEWRQLHPFVKFLILSLVVHLLFLLFVQTREEDPLPGGPAGERAFAVQFMAAPASSHDTPVAAATGDRVPESQSLEASVATGAMPNVAPAELAEAAPATSVSSRSAPSLTESEVPSPLPDRQAKTDAMSRPKLLAASSGPPQKTAADPTPSARQSAEAASVAPRASASASDPVATLGPATEDLRAETPSSLTEAPSVMLPTRTASESLADERPASPEIARAERSGRPSLVPPAAAAEGIARKSATSDVATRTSEPNAFANREIPQAPGVATSLPMSDLMPDADAQGTPEGFGPTGGARRNPLGENHPPAATLVRRSSRRPSIGNRPMDAIAARRSPVAEESIQGLTEARAVDEGARIVAAASSRGTSSVERVVGSTDGVPTAPSYDVRRSAATETVPAPALALGPRRRPRSVGTLARAAGRVDLAERTSDTPPDTSGKPTSVVTSRLSPQLTASGRGGESAAGAFSDASFALMPPDYLTPRVLAEAPAEAPSVYAQRSGAARARALLEAGGSEETEAAVLAGLRYLKSRQQRDGSIGRAARDSKYGDVEIGKTALALLAFLGAGATQRDAGEFQSTVQASLNYLSALQDRDSGHFGYCSSYGHAIATYAFAEAYAMTSDPALKPPLIRGVRRILAAQVNRPGQVVDGGFGYYYSEEERQYDGWPRMSITVWQIMALESARLSGISVPDEVLLRARSFVESSHDPRRKAIRYNHDPAWLRSSYAILPGSVSGALFAMQLLGIDEQSPGFREALSFVEARPPRGPWRKPSSDAFVHQGVGNEYYMYYATLALRLLGGEAWKQWNEQLKPLLLTSQDRNGSWRPISHYAEYAKDTDRDRVYTTAMCVLMLEVYYRYDTPLLKQLAQGFREKRVPTAKARTAVFVRAVDKGGVADQAGMRAGDEIQSLLAKPVATLEDVVNALEKAASAGGTVIVLRHGIAVELGLTSRLSGVDLEERDL